MDDIMANPSFSDGAVYLSFSIAAGEVQVSVMPADDLTSITRQVLFRKTARKLGLTVRFKPGHGKHFKERRKADIVEDYRRQLLESQCQSGSACGPDMPVDEQVAETASNPRETPPTGPFSHSQDFVVGGKRCAICCTPCRTGLTVADGCPWTVCSLQCKLRANDRRCSIWCRRNAVHVCCECCCTCKL